MDNMTLVGRMQSELRLGDMKFDTLVLMRDACSRILELDNEVTQLRMEVVRLKKKAKEQEP